MSDVVINHGSFSPDEGYEIKNLVVKSKTISIKIFCDSPDGTISYSLQAAEIDPTVSVKTKQTDKESVKILVEGADEKSENNSFAGFASLLRRGRSEISAILEVHTPPNCNLALSNQTGSIIINGSAGIIKAETGTGKIKVEKANFAKASTGTGNIEINECSGSEISTGTGSINATVLAGKCAASTGTGKITVRLPRNTPIWHKMSSGLGKCKIDIEPYGKPAPDEPFIEVVCSSGLGTIHLKHVD